ncbi:uncharacterized protein LOC122053306 isoform X2 [Zingiber officinale]|uniref:Uncharacterized protein n=1 Tax=Zingiber officinale TaxID=94328 RepID=A0A8J5HAQ0_ZINOF|nr:uncharacterized protein LOC122053306 isoform X2 [Zingiber officinale]KAG6522919.1 hypothetical protein ZIOFF_020075 [Zingiber officinale]
MDGRDDLHDWEILPGPEVDCQESDPLEASAGGSSDGAVEFDSFSLHYPIQHRRGIAYEEEAVAVEKVDPNNPASSIDPQSNSQLLPEHLNPSRSDEPSDGERSHLGREKGEFGGTRGLLTRDNTGDEEDNEGAIVKEREGRGTGFVKPDEQNYNSSMEIGDKENEDDSGHALANGGEKKGVVWWKLPFELLTFCALKAKPLWSISIAAAVVGVWMLKKRLYRGQKTQIVPLRIILHEKKALQLKIHAKRLDEAYNIARRVIVVRSSHLLAA